MSPPYTFAVSIVSIIYVTLPLVLHGVHAEDLSMKLPGFMPGAVAYFNYKNEKNLGTIVFAIKDSLGSGLHMEIHHNEGCTGTKGPYLALNTIENGVFGTWETLQLSNPDPGNENNAWVFSAHYDELVLPLYFVSIRDPNFESSNKFFLNRSPHNKSIVTELTLHEKKTCGTTSFEPNLGYYRWMNEFSEINFQASKFSPDNYAFLDVNNRRLDFEIDSNAIKAVDDKIGTVCTIDGQALDDLEVGVKLKHVENDDFMLTLSATKACPITVPDGTKIAKFEAYLDALTAFNFK